jgi:hypothetical protein
MTGSLILNADPIATLGAATKQYVDNQQLSSQFTNIVGPSNNDLLAFDTGTLKWVNKTAIAAGVLALSGGVMNGVINMGGFGITNLPALASPYPVNPTDAATKAYVDSVASGANGITTITYNNNTGTLSLTQLALPNNFTIPGFLPSPGGVLQSTLVVYTPPEPANVYPVPGLFVQSTLDDSGLNPTSMQLNAVVSELDIGLGNFTEPKQRFVFPAVGTSTLYNLNTGAPLTVITPPRMQYVVGSNNISVYINGIKQIAADSGKYSILGVDTTNTYTGVTFSGSTLTVPGNFSNILRSGVNINISGTSTTNDGDYIITSSSNVGPDTVIVVTPNTSSLTPGTTPFVVSGTGTLTYGPYGILPGMPTGFTLGGPVNTKTFFVGVNGFANVTVTIDVSTVNCTTFGLLIAAINNIVAKHYINSVVGVTSGPLGNFVVSGDRTAEFLVGTIFNVRHSTGNNGSYTVGPGAPTFALGQTTIPITTSISSGVGNGVIYNDRWGFTATIQNGTIVFYSNISGVGSAVVPTDGGMFSSITGTTWPVTITTPLTGTTNSLSPSDYSYKELGMQGYQSSLIVFNTAPAITDVVEVVIDREVIYNKSNPFSTAVTV